MLTDQLTLNLFTTKQDAFNRLGESLKGNLRGRIYRVLRRSPMTRQEIAEVTGIPLNVVCARVCELEDLRLIGVRDVKVNPVSGVRVQQLGVYY